MPSIQRNQVSCAVISKNEIFTYTINSLNETNNGTTLSLGKNEVVTLHPALAQMLGFPNNHLTNHRKVAKDRLRIKSSLLPSLGTEPFNLYIYSNIVKDTLVGDTLMPLLRTIPVIDEVVIIYVFDKGQP